MDVLGLVIRNTSYFRGKGKLVDYWLKHRNINKTKRTTLKNGYRISCDLSIQYEANVWLGQEEDKDLAIVSKLLKPGQTFIDCGANIGLWSLTASAAVESDGKVISFEPNPVTADKLKSNIELNQVKNIKLYNSAVGSLNGTVFFECNNDHNISSIVKEQKNSIEVPIVTIDSILQDRKVHGIKIDVEGYEMEVILGAKQLLESSKPWLCIEFNSETAGVSFLNDWNVHQYLSKFGYKAKLFSEAINSKSPEILESNYRVNGYVNLFYFHS